MRNSSENFFCTEIVYLFFWSGVNLTAEWIDLKTRVPNHLFCRSFHWAHDAFDALCIIIIIVITSNFSLFVSMSWSSSPTANQHKVMCFKFFGEEVMSESVRLKYIVDHEAVSIECDLKRSSTQRWRIIRLDIYLGVA